MLVSNTRLHFFILSFLVIIFSMAAAISHADLPVTDSQNKNLPSLAPMLDRVMPGVVNIATTGYVRIRENPLLNDPFFRRFFKLPKQPRQRRTQSLGSGVVVDAKKGYILTNNHVIDKADVINVTFRTGETRQAKLIGTDPDTDIAVIQVKGNDLTAISLADSSRLRVGDFAVAIGNPFGLGQTVTSGIISALGRSGLGIEGYEDFIQTDASINPGNSGGALVNLSGELIGINTAILSRSGGNIGIGFAIPINMAKKIMQQIMAHGEVRRGQLGAQAQDLSPRLARAFGIKNIHSGAVITRVEKDSAADRTGLKTGDIVTEINGKHVRDASTLRNGIGLVRVGETVILKILREGQRLILRAKVEALASGEQPGKSLHPHLQGALMTNIAKNSRYYGRIDGVLIARVEPGSPAWRAGLRKDDVITSVNRRKIKSLGALRKAIQPKKTLLLSIRRGNSALFLYLR